MGSLGPTEIILILLVVILLFGAKKLPDLARGSGRALRIFKAETKGLMDENDKDDEQTDAHGRPLPAGSDVQRPSFEQAPPSTPATETPSEPTVPPATHDQPR